MKALFISDLHLQQSSPKTTQAFFNFLENEALQAEAVYFLGDLFEFWVGDDTIGSPYIQTLVQAIRHVSDAGVSLFWISGNRDFLVGEQFAQAAGLTLLPELFVADIAGKKIILVHGDAQCTDDHAYMEFRAMVQSPAVQKQFLAMPIEQRIAVLSGYRKESQGKNKEKTAEIMDVNPSAISQLFEQSGASILIHGHTHRPGCFTDPQHPDRIRYVLPDWDLETEPAKGGWVELNDEGELKLHLFNQN